MEAITLSRTPTDGSVDNVIRIPYTLVPNSTRLSSDSAFLNAVKISHPGLILETGKLHRYHDVPSGGVGV